VGTELGDTVVTGIGHVHIVVGVVDRDTTARDAVVVICWARGKFVTGDFPIGSHEAQFAGPFTTRYSFPELACVAVGGVG
jgi:hypothetical protein